VGRSLRRDAEPSPLTHVGVSDTSAGPRRSGSRSGSGRDRTCAGYHPPATRHRRCRGAACWARPRGLYPSGGYRARHVLLAGPRTRSRLPLPASGGSWRPCGFPGEDLPLCCCDFQNTSHLVIAKPPRGRAQGGAKRERRSTADAPAPLCFLRGGAGGGRRRPHSVSRGRCRLPDTRPLPIFDRLRRAWEKWP